MNQRTTLTVHRSYWILLTIIGLCLSIGGFITAFFATYPFYTQLQTSSTTFLAVNQSTILNPPPLPPSFTPQHARVSLRANASTSLYLNAPPLSQLINVSKTEVQVPLNLSRHLVPSIILTNLGPNNTAVDTTYTVQGYYHPYHWLSLPSLFLGTTGFVIALYALYHLAAYLKIMRRTSTPIPARRTR